MARKDQRSPEMDECDICGAILDDQAVVQEFPDGSLVKLCGKCASETSADDDVPAVDEPELERVRHRGNDPRLDEATVEWSGPDEPPSRAHGRPTPDQLQAEDFDIDDETTDYSKEQSDVSGVEAELAAWASAPHRDQDDSDEDLEPSADYSEEAEEAAHELAAALVEADVADAVREGHDPGEADQATGEEDAAWVDTPPPGLPPLPDNAGASAPPLPVDPAALVPPPLPLGSEPAPAPPPLPTKLEAEGAEAPPEATADQPAADTEQATGQDEKTPEEEQEQAAAAEEEAESAAEPASAEEAGAAIGDLVALRSEMQSALSRLSSTLEHFVSEITASEEKTKAMTSRLHQLEDELDSTRERLRLAEGLPPEDEPSSESESSSKDEAPADEKGEAAPTDAEKPEGEQATDTPVPPPPPEDDHQKAAAKTKQEKAAAVVPPPLSAGAAPAGGVVPPPLPGPRTDDSAAPTPEKPRSAPKGAAPSAPPKLRGTPRLPSTAAAAGAAAKAIGGAASAAAGAAAPPPIPTPSVTSSASAAVAGAAAAVQKLFRGRKDRNESDSEPRPQPEPEDPGLAFNINELQAAQRYFNTSEFVKKVRDISRSIGKPQANLSRTSPGESLAAVTIFWDIVWYQYLIDLRKELPPEDQRIWLDREGMDLEELDPRFTHKNATVNDDGRVDASLMEIDLLSDPSAVMPEEEPVDPTETRFEEDATEEIWDHRSAPDFRWD